MANAVIYPSSIDTDKKKLFACYSLVQQMIDEHNRQSSISRDSLNLVPIPEELVIALAAGEKWAKDKAKEFIPSWCPEGYMIADTPENKSLRDKFRTYAKEQFDPRLKQVLAERNRLIDKLIRDNYTEKEWKELGKDEEKLQAAYDGFGKKSDLCSLATTAECPPLDELKAIDIAKLSSTEGVDPLEDFYSDYTEYDEGGDVTIAEGTPNKISWTGLETRDDTAYVYKDKGINHFDGDFEHLVKVTLTASIRSQNTCHWMVANHIGDTNDIGSGDALFARWSTDILPIQYIRIWEIDGGTTYYDTWEHTDALTTYYMTIVRDDDDGTYGSLTKYVCTGAHYGEGGSTLKDTLSLSLHTSKKDFRYIYGLATRDTASGTGFTSSGYVEDLDLQEGVAHEGSAFFPFM